MLSNNSKKRKPTLPAEANYPIENNGLDLTQTNSDTFYPAASFKLRIAPTNTFVDVDTGLPTNLQGADLALAKTNKNVITKQAYYQRQLVDVDTGDLTQLTGEALALAKTNKMVISRNTYQ